MKISGNSLSRSIIYGPLVFKRGDNFIAFYATPVWDIGHFEKILPPPKPPERFTPKGKEADVDHPDYKAELKSWSDARYGWILASSLSESGIEWETVDKNDPKTYANVPKELEEALPFYERNLVINLVEEANALDPRKLEGNLESFFREQERLRQLVNQDPNTEAGSFKSSEPAQD